MCPERAMNENKSLLVLARAGPSHAAFTFGSVLVAFFLSPEACKAAGSLADNAGLPASFAADWQRWVMDRLIQARGYLHKLLLWRQSHPMEPFEICIAFAGRSGV